MSQQQSLHEERMQRSLNALVALWWCPGTSEEDLFFIASELGLKNEFYQLVKPREPKLAIVGR